MPEEKQATCACGSGIPIQHLLVNGEDVTVIALPVILANFKDQGKLADEATAREILEAVKIYNPLPVGSDAAFLKVLLHAYSAVKADQI
jgi:3-dehydroquinate synthase class II